MLLVAAKLPMIMPTLTLFFTIMVSSLVYAQVTDNPLDELVVPENWQLVTNQQVFNDERKRHIVGTDVAFQSFDTQCFNLLKHWQSNVVKHAKAGRARFQQCQQKLNIYGYAGFAPGSSHVPPEIQELYLHWAETNALLPNLDRANPDFEKYSYDTGVALGSYASYYATFYDQFDYAEAERAQVNRLFIEGLLYVEPKHLLPSHQTMCDANALQATAKGLSLGQTSANTCGGILWAQMQGQLLLGLRTQNQALFEKGIETLKWNLNFFDDEGIFIPYAAGKGAHALDYTAQIPHYLGVLTEIFATLGYDFLEHKIPAGLSIKQVLDGQVKVFADHKLLLKYNASERGLFKGFGWSFDKLNNWDSEQAPTLTTYRWTMADYKKWAPEEARRLASYSWTQFARQAARYVDQHRPDLAKYHSLDYVAYGENSKSIDMITARSALDPYMFYEANYLASVGAALSSSNSKKQSGASYSYVPTTEKKPAYVSASHRNKHVSAQQRLALLALKLTGMSAKAAQSGEGLSKVGLEQGVYIIDWYLVKDGTSQDDWQLLGSDQITWLDNPQKLILGEKHFFPSAAYRQNLLIWLYPDQTITMQGELDYGYYGLSPKSFLKGSLKSGFGYGDFGVYRDILAFTIRPDKR